MTTIKNTAIAIIGIMNHINETITTNTRDSPISPPPVKIRVVINKTGTNIRKQTSAHADMNASMGLDRKQ